MASSGHLQRNSTMELVPKKQHLAFPKRDTGVTTTPEQQPTKLQPTLRREPWHKMEPTGQPSPETVAVAAG